MPLANKTVKYILAFNQMALSFYDKVRKLFGETPSYYNLHTQTDNLHDEQQLQMGIKTLRYSNIDINTKLEHLLEDIYLQVQKQDLNKPHPCE